MAASPHLRTVFLGSGSSGNASVITDGKTTVLVDCGFSAREIATRMGCAGIDPSAVSAILVTHEHSDHQRGIDVFARRYAPACTVMATAGTLRRITMDRGRVDTATLTAGEPVTVGTLQVLPFRTSHDAAEPVGYRFDAQGFSVGIATDTGVLTPEAREALAGVCLLGIESNHDVRMLETGPYPAFLKRRIRGASGHLSNHDAALAVESLASDRLRHVFGLHRSRTNNTAVLAADALEHRLRQIGLAVPVTVASQIEVCDSHPPQSTLFSDEELA